MGLAEKRSAEEFKTSSLPALQSRIDAAAGFAVPIEVSWDQLAVAGQTASYKDYFTKVYFEPLIAALGSVAADEMGKNALNAGLKKVVMANSGSFIGPSGITFQGGVLTIDHKPDTNVDDVAARTKKIKDVIEAAL